MRKIAARRARSRAACAAAPALLLALVAGSAGLACNRQRDAETPVVPPPPRPVMISIARDPGLLDPLRAGDPAVARVSVLLHEGLVIFDDSLRVHPGVAAQWKFTHKGKRLQLEIDPRARFADGRVVRPADVRFTLERLLEPLNSSGATHALADLVGADAFRAGKVDSVSGIVCSDSSTVVLRFESAVGPILECLADPRAAIVPHGLPNGTEPPGLGPWMVSERDAGRSLRLVPRPGYHGTAPLAPGLGLVIEPDPWRRREAFEHGQTDLYEQPIGVTAPRRAGSDPGASIAGWSQTIVAINCQKYPFDTWRVRQALNHAVNTAEITSGLKGNAGQRANGPIPPGMPGDVKNLAPYRYDPAWARELLQAAGFARGFFFEVWYVHDAEAKRLLDAMRLDLREVGIELKAIDRSEAELRAGIERGTPDAVLRTIVPGHLGSHGLLRERFHSGQFGADGNLSGYESRKVDRLIDRILRTRDPKERGRRVAEAERMLHEAAPWVFLWHPRRVVFTAPEIEGYRITPDPRLQRYLTVRRRVPPETGGEPAPPPLPPRREGDE